MMLKKFYVVVAVGLGVAFAGVIMNEDVKTSEILFKDIFEVQPYIFESQVLQAFNKLMEFLKNGDPSNNIPPIDPFFLSFQSFDFIINDTILEGFFKNTTIYNFSGFEAQNIKFKLLPLHFQISVFLKDLLISGMYKLAGSIFNEIPLNGSGKFISETRNLNISLCIRPTVINSSFQIKDLFFEFKALNEKINYTNEYENNKLVVLDEKLALYVLNKVQTKYVPPLLQTGKLVLNHFLLGFTAEDIMKTILEFLSKNKTTVSNIMENCIALT